MTTELFNEYLSDLEIAGVSVDVLEFIVKVYGNSQQTIKLLNDAAWYYLSVRDNEQTHELVFCGA